ncbi:MAG: tol-pal system protein YbgF [Deltaproteobacteria bacterium]|nr:tol-pal system protein YbgF [Deltaproteobacteria bacterium]
MLGRFSLLVLILGISGCGCASVSEDRIALLESAVMDLQTQEMRLASLEETVAALVARTEVPAGRPGPGTNDGRTPPGSPQASSSSVTDPPTSTGSAGGRPVQATPSVSVPDTQPGQPSPPLPGPVKKINNAQASREYQAALSTLEAGRPQAALTRFQDFLARYPGHSLAPNAGYWLGECYYSMKRYDAAVIAFKDVVAQFPHHEKAAAALLKAGYSYALLGDVPNARFYLEALIKDFPSSQPASLARARLASL